MKEGDRFRYVGRGFDLQRMTGRIEYDGSHGGDGPPCWHVSFDDGRAAVLSPEEVAPESAVDQLGQLAPESVADQLSDLA